MTCPTNSSAFGNFPPHRILLANGTSENRLDNTTPREPVHCTEDSRNQPPVARSRSALGSTAIPGSGPNLWCSRTPWRHIQRTRHALPRRKPNLSEGISKSTGFMLILGGNPAGPRSASTRPATNCLRKPSGKKVQLSTVNLSRRRSAAVVGPARSVLPFPRWQLPHH